MRGFSGYSDATKPVFDAALDVLKAQGAELVEIPVDMFEDLSQEQRTIMLYDIKQDMAAYLKDAPPAVKSRTLADLIEFNKTEEHEKLHTQDLFEDAEATSGRDNPEFIKTAEYAKRRAGEDGYGKAMKDFNVSALVLLTSGPAGVIPPDETSGGHPASVHEKGARPPSGSGTAALAGYPDLNVPTGFVEGMPVGISFIGMPWSEATLLAYGFAYATRRRHMPAKAAEAYKKSASRSPSEGQPPAYDCTCSIPLLTVRDLPWHPRSGSPPVRRKRPGAVCGGGSASVAGVRRSGGRQDHFGRRDQGRYGAHQDL